MWTMCVHIFSRIAAQFSRSFKCRHLPNKEHKGGKDHQDSDRWTSPMDTRIADEERRSARARMQCIQRYAALFISIIITATAVLVDSLFTQVKEPYHTSILTGEGWIMELLSGHPNCIRCELGVSHNLFSALISDLRGMGHVNLKYVSLEEQLGIFLYMSVTGLTIRHVGERFQRSNETISR